MIISFFSSFLFYLSIPFFLLTLKMTHTTHILHTMSMNNQVFISRVYCEWRERWCEEGRKKEGKRQDAARDDDGDLCDRRIDSTRRFFTHTHVQARQFERREKSTRRVGFEDFRFPSLFFGFSQFFIKKSESEWRREEGKFFFYP